MIERNRRSNRTSQRGWSLVESVVVVLLVGVMATGVWKTLSLVGKNQEVEHSREVLERADHALYGMVLRDTRLPVPDGATPMPGQPNHMVGWLPAGVLDTEPPRSIRYIVDSALVTAPASVIYQTDPMGLLEGLTLAQRTTANGLDFCLTVIRQEQSGAAALNGMNVAFGVQHADQQGTPGSGVQPFQLGAAAPGAGTRLSTRAAGHSELVHRMGCIPAFARLATQVKAAAVFNDLYEIARINTDLRALEWRAARDFLRSHQWRHAVGISRLTSHVIKTAINGLSMYTTPVGFPIAVGNIAMNALVMALWVELIDLSRMGAEANAAALPDSEQAYDYAREFSDDLADKRNEHLDNVTEFQNKGVQP